MQMFKEYINEVLNKPYKWKLEFNKKDAVQYTFKIDEDLSYVVDFEYTEFHLLSKEIGAGWGIVFTSQGKIVSWDLTKTGNEFRVFATIKEIFNDWYKKHPNETFYFSAKEKSRVRLYTRFSDLIKKIYKRDYKKIENYGEIDFVFKV